MSTVRVLIGTMTGFALGALTGILFAPKKGSNTRKQIKYEGDKYMGKLKSKYNKYADSLTEKFEGTKNEADKFLDKGKGKFDDAKKEVKQAATNFKNDGVAEAKHGTY